MSGLVASAMGVLHPPDRLVSVREIRQVDQGVYTKAVYKCRYESGLAHDVYYVETDGVRGYSGRDLLVYIYERSR
jgi:hypothetical protein